MAQNKFSSWVKMLVNPLKPNVFNTHLPKMLNLRAKFYEFVLYYSMSTNPNLAFGKHFVMPHKKRERWLKWTRQTYPKKKKKTLICFVRENKNGNLVLDHTKEQLDLHQS